MKRLLLSSCSFVFFAAALLAYPQGERKTAPCDNFPDNPHPCHCYDMEKNEKCDDPPPPPNCSDDGEGGQYCDDNKMGPENSGHNHDGSRNMGKKCQKNCDPKKCQCEDTCKS